MAPGRIGHIADPLHCDDREWILDDVGTPDRGEPPGRSNKNLQAVQPMEPCSEHNQDSFYDL